MANTATYMRFSHRRARFHAKSLHLYKTLEQSKLALDDRREAHIFASVRAFDRGHGAGGTQIRRPMIRRGLPANQAAFLDILATKIITIKVWTFNTCRGAHESPFNNEPIAD